MIDVLVVYTAAAEANNPNVETIIGLSVDQLNNTLKNSLGNNPPIVSFNVVIHDEPIIYNELDQQGNPLSAMTHAERLLARSHGLDVVHSLRASYGTDIAVMIINDAQNCGEAPVINAPDVNSAVAVVKFECSRTNKTFAHEIGHVIGGNHAIASAGSAEGYYKRYARGMATPSDNTIMVGDVTNRIPFWSDPDKSVGNYAIGEEDTCDINGNGEIDGNEVIDENCAGRNMKRTWLEQSDHFAGFDNPPVSQETVDIVGPTRIIPGQIIAFTAQTSCTINCAYQWYVRFDSGGNWFPYGENVQSIFIGFSDDDYEMRVDVFNGGEDVAAVDTHGIEICDASNCTKANLDVILSGVYNTSTDEMNTDLRNLATFPTFQPYFAPPWRYFGQESTSPSNYPDLVDWILVELRTGTDPNTTVARRPALLMKDGSVFDRSGNSTLSINAPPGQSYYVVVRHRNHLDIMSKNSVFSPSGSNLTYDFTSGVDQVWGDDLNEVETGIFSAYAGDATADGQVYYIGANRDQLPIIDLLEGVNNLAGSIPGYHLSDMNMDGKVEYIGADRDQLPIIETLGTNNLADVKLSHVPGSVLSDYQATPTLTGEIYMSFFSWFPVVRFQSDQAISGHKTQFMFKLTWPLTPSNPAPTILSSAYDLSLLQSGSDSLSYAYYVADIVAGSPQSVNFSANQWYELASLSTSIDPSKLSVAEMTLGVNANNFVLDSGSAPSKTSQAGQDAVVEAEVPASYQLGAAYPNPFNPTTRIEYALPTESLVRIEIFNLLGQRVNVLVDALQPAGFKSIQWNGTNHTNQKLPSGTYLYRIIANDFIDVRSVVLLK